MFYISKYPIVTYYRTDNKPEESIPAGTAFYIKSIGMSGMILFPVEKQEGLLQLLEYSPQMLELGFSKVDQLPRSE